MQIKYVPLLAKLKLSYLNLQKQLDFRLMEKGYTQQIQ